MAEYKVKTRYKKLLADTMTPVSIYLQLRDRFVNSILLESSDYHTASNSFSYICCEPVASFKINQGNVSQLLPDGKTVNFSLASPQDAVKALQGFSSRFEVDDELNFPFITNGLFGHISYDAVGYFEDIIIQPQEQATEVDQIFYQVFRYVIAINHFKNELYLFEHSYAGGPEASDGLERLEVLIRNRNIPDYDFKATSPESSNTTDDEMRQIVRKCIDHCLRGDVFQIVPSRRFSRKYRGDDFNVYRALRSINPSPYLFYFDYGSYRIFGSSPEKQIYIKGTQAEIHPIAGTFRRTGDDAADALAAQSLLDDPKESAEHVMLVDLARNDLSRNCHDVKVDTYKEVQYYSHVIHLVSTVTGQMSEGTNSLQLVADTFPAGTLSGAPKHMAMTIINDLETTNRSIYGGAIGFMGFNGDFNHAIAIRTFFSKDNTLYYRAGMGVVARSNVENELQEINNKLAALRKAIGEAEAI